MIVPKLVANGLNHAWAGAVIVVAVLIVAGCELPGVEQTVRPGA